MRIHVTSLVTPCAEVGIYGGLEVDINRFIHNFQPLAHHEFQLLKRVGNLTKVFSITKLQVREGISLPRSREHGQAFLR